MQRFALLSQFKSKLTYFLVTGIALLILSGCQSLPVIDTRVANVPLSNKKFDAVMGTVIVQLAPQDARRGYLSDEAQAITPEWRNSIIDALTRSKVFTPGAKRIASVRVNIIQVESKDNDDLSITTTVTASYELVDAATQELIWIRGIATSNRVSFQEATVESTRKRISLNRAIQSNILQFVQILGHIEPTYDAVPPQELRLRQN